MSTTTSDKNTATVLNNGPVYYTEITGSAFEHVINDDGGVQVQSRLEMHRFRRFDEFPHPQA